MMNWIFTAFLVLSVICSCLTGQIRALSLSVLQGAHSGISLAISIAGALCLWSGVGKVMDRAGLIHLLRRFLSPLLGILFPSTRKDGVLAGYLSANICANFLGLGNAATPMGIQAAKRMRSPADPTRATDEMCRLVVLNTASIQLIPATVASVRASLGCKTPFDILGAVWLSSILSAGIGVGAAWLLGKVWRND